MPVRGARPKAGPCKPMEPADAPSPNRKRPATSSPPFTPPEKKERGSDDEAMSVATFNFTASEKKDQQGRSKPGSAPPAAPAPPPPPPASVGELQDAADTRLRGGRAGSAGLKPVSDLASGELLEDKDRCIMCADKKASKSKYCPKHKRVDDCLRKDAEKKRNQHGSDHPDWLAYQRLQSNSIAYMSAIAQFLQDNPDGKSKQSSGTKRGVPRWDEYVHTFFATQEKEDNVKRIPMDFQWFANVMKNNRGWTFETAKEEWAIITSDPDNFKDNNGPRGFKDRWRVPGNLICADEEVDRKKIGETKALLHGTKRQRMGNSDRDTIKRELARGLSSNVMAEFGAGSSSSASGAFAASLPLNAFTGLAAERSEKALDILRDAAAKASTTEHHATDDGHDGSPQPAPSASEAPNGQPSAPDVPKTMSPADLQRERLNLKSELKTTWKTLTSKLAAAGIPALTAIKEADKIEDAEWLHILRQTLSISFTIQGKNFKSDGAVEDYDWDAFACAEKDCEL